MKGFTVIELLVSLTIFSVITTIVLYNYGNFNSQIIVTNLAYEVALEIRTAQVYGLSVLGSNVDGGYTFNSGYGVHFSIDDPQHFYLFIDAGSRGVPWSFTTNSPMTLGELASCLPGSGCVEKLTLQGASRIEKFCATENNQTQCFPSPIGNVTGNSPGDSIDITFRRPDPDAHVTYTTVTGPSTLLPNARIYLISSDKKTEKIITVDQSGQISIQ